jgi:hypothetical protein
VAVDPCRNDKSAARPRCVGIQCHGPASMWIKCCCTLQNCTNLCVWIRRSSKQEPDKGLSKAARARSRSVPSRKAAYCPSTHSRSEMTILQSCVSLNPLSELLLRCAGSMRPISFVANDIHIPNNGLTSEHYVVLYVATPCCSKALVLHLVWSLLVIIRRVSE